MSEPEKTVDCPVLPALPGEPGLPLMRCRELSNPGRKQRPIGPFDKHLKETCPTCPNNTWGRSPLSFDLSYWQRDQAKGSGQLDVDVEAGAVIAEAVCNLFTRLPAITLADLATDLRDMAQIKPNAATERAVKFVTSITPPPSQRA